MWKAARASLFIFVLSIFAASLAKAAEPLKFEPAAVQVSGRVLGDYVFLGDGKMKKATILHLEEAVIIEGNPESKNSKKTLGNIHKILLEPEDDVDLDELAGKEVTLEGRLFHSPNIYHHTEVLMKVEKVVKVNEQ